MIVFNAGKVRKQCNSKFKGIKFCVGLRSTEVSDHRGYFLYIMLVNDILVGLVDHVGVGLERFNCMYVQPLESWLAVYHL